MEQVYNTGIYRKGKYNTSKDKKAYTLWKSILQRCYDEKSLVKFPTYRGCNVCDEWIYFQTFAEWFYQNYIDGYTLDKDILGDGKLYSPSTCCFVPNHVNNIIHINKHKQTELPVGVVVQDGKYRVRVNTLTKKKQHIGYFDNEIDAVNAYKQAKIKVISDVTRHYNLPNIIKESLINKLFAA
ncbi:MAG: hypothetical protein ACOC22_01040 [bacterium]